MPSLDYPRHLRARLAALAAPLAAVVGLLGLVGATVAIAAQEALDGPALRRQGPFFGHAARTAPYTAAIELLYMGANPALVTCEVGWDHGRFSASILAGGRRSWRVPSGSVIRLNVLSRRPLPKKPLTLECRAEYHYIG